jgi:hypothetical protein
MEGLKALVFSLGTAAAAVALLSAAKQVDARAEASRISAEVSASVSAKERSQQEANLLVHDDILSTLIFASSKDRLIRATVAHQALKARARIEQMAQEETRNEELSAEEFVDLIEAVIAQTEHPVPLTIEGLLPLSATGDHVPVLAVNVSPTVVVPEMVGIGAVPNSAVAMDAVSTLVCEEDEYPAFTPVTVTEMTWLASAGCNTYVDAVAESIATPPRFQT